jgi:hypothetical protein
VRINVHFVITKFSNLFYSPSPVKSTATGLRIRYGRFVQSTSADACLSCPHRPGVELQNPASRGCKRADRRIPAVQTCEIGMPVFSRLSYKPVLDAMIVLVVI